MPYSIGVVGVEESFDTANKEVTELVNTINRAEAVATLADLKTATPVDTGRARASWVLTYAPNKFKDTVSYEPEILRPVSKTKIDTVYITNGVDYIEDLNAGSSSQASARFIERVVLKRYNPEGVIYQTL